ncbi:MAG: flagellar biosynthesis protein FlhF [Syntrophomonadaceae bacterium]
MKIKKYVAKDFKTAVESAKSEMGRDAIILHTQKIKKSGILGFFSSPRVEVTVAADENLKVKLDQARANPSEKDNNDFSAINDSNSLFSTKTVKRNVNEADLIVQMQKMNSLMADIKARIYEVEVIKGLPEQVKNLYQILINNNVEQGIALNVVGNVASRLSHNAFSDDTWVRNVCLHTLQEYIYQIEPIKIVSERKGMVVFMVGPTGVGKTTTIAKLAANFTFLENKQVALITLDTYRVSAAEQLKTFADIIGIPISIVFTPADLLLAIKQYKDKDIIFVDTAGRSPYDTNQMQELQEYVYKARPDETILVLSVTTDSNDLINIYHRFQGITIDKLIFTKLDETQKYGSILNALYVIKKPLAYLTIGQNVPDDIEIPDSLHLAQMFLRRRDETYVRSGR